MYTKKKRGGCPYEKGSGVKRTPQNKRVKNHRKHVNRVDQESYVKHLREGVMGVTIT